MMMMMVVTFVAVVVVKLLRVKFSAILFTHWALHSAHAKCMRCNSKKIIKMRQLHRCHRRHHHSFIYWLRCYFCVLFSLSLSSLAPWSNRYSVYYGFAHNNNKKSNHFLIRIPSTQLVLRTESAQRRRQPNLKKKHHRRKRRSRRIKNVLMDFFT